MDNLASKRRKRLWIGLVVLSIICLAITSYFVGIPFSKNSEGKAQSPTKPESTRLKVDLVKGDGVPEHTLSVPEEVRLSLGIRKNNVDLFDMAKEPTGNRPIVLLGSTMLDPSHLHRIRARFAPARVVEITKHTKRTLDGTELRELGPGDEVKEGDVLGVFESIDVGAKKNDLIDALVAMKLDKEIRDNAEDSNAIPYVLKLVYRKNVETDQNTIDRALRALELWEIPKADIDAVYRAAEEIIQKSGKRDDRRDPKWGLVELRAPEAGVIIERNVNAKELVQDPTTQLFQIAKIDKILILANAHEDEFRELFKRKKELEQKGQRLRWRIRPEGTSEEDEIVAPIDEIGYLVDQNQHTIPIKGRIPNPKGILRGGQFVTVTIELPPPDDTVEIPASAVIDDGKQAIVFVQREANKPNYTMRRVHVTQRFNNRVFVSSKLSAKEMELTAEDREQGLLPRRPLVIGERVLTAGLLELKKELEDRESDQGE